MAEFIFKSMANNLGVSDKFSVCSRATSDEEIWNGVGQPIYPKAKEQLLYHGIAIGDKKAIQLKEMIIMKRICLSAWTAPIYVI